MERIDLESHIKKMDALVSDILELCEKKGVTMFQMSMLASRLDRAIQDELRGMQTQVKFYRANVEFNPSAQA